MAHCGSGSCTVAQLRRQCRIRLRLSRKLYSCAQAKHDLSSNMRSGEESGESAPRACSVHPFVNIVGIPGEAAR